MTVFYISFCFCYSCVCTYSYYMYTIFVLECTYLVQKAMKVDKKLVLFIKDFARTKSNTNSSQITSEYNVLSDEFRRTVF